MSSSYRGSPLVRWVNDRLPVFSFLDHQMRDYAAPRNLEVPPYAFTGDTTIRIG